MNELERKEYLQTFGSYVKYLREQAGWTQDELAEKCGYTSDTRKSTIQKIEKGKSDLQASKIRTLATVFGISPSDLLDPPTEARENILACELFEKCHGKEAFQMVQSFLKLDSDDRLIIYGEVLGMLKAEKYNEENTKQNA